MSQSSSELLALADRVRSSARALARQSTAKKDDALQSIARALREHTDEILLANSEDLERLESSDRDAAFADRLRLDANRIESMAAAVDEVVHLPDPVGRVDSMWKRPNGLEVGRKRIPLGVIGIIYEARPNVTSDAAALCLKSGNAVLLKGGSDAIASNRAIYKAMQAGLEASTLDREAIDAIGFIDSTDRDVVREMLGLEHHLDVVIPRGGKGLIRFVSEHARMPVIKHDEGVCHVVVDGTSDLEMARDIVLNAKVQRPTVCNAAETLLVLSNARDTHLPTLLEALHEAGVTLHCDDDAFAAAQKLGLDDVHRADDASYRAEFLGLEIAVRVVDDLEDAIDHIATFGSRHTEAIVTNDVRTSRRFVDEVDSSCVVVNASTRFADGNQLGLGAEIGISTTRLHAYGPMGIEELTTTKFVVFGDGQTRN
jgi:glutamate-5-semialdehyde dehydrogenase